MYTASQSEICEQCQALNTRFGKYCLQRGGFVVASDASETHSDVVSVKRLLGQLGSDTTGRMACWVARALQGTSERETIPLLLEALKDDNAEVRACVAEALGGIAANKKTSRTAIKRIASALIHASKRERETENARFRIVEALGRAGSKAIGETRIRTASALIEMASDERESARACIARSLGRIGAVSRVKLREKISETCLLLLHDPSPFVRACSAASLGEIGVRAGKFNRHIAVALFPFLKQDKERDERVRAAVAKSLGQIGLVTIRETRRQIVDSLTPCISDPSEDVRFNTIWALGRIGLKSPRKRAIIIPALTAALRDTEGNRASAAKLLGDIGMHSKGKRRDQISIALMPLLQDAVAVFAWAAHALKGMKITAVEAIPDLVKILAHGNANVRFWAAESIGEFGSKAVQAVPRLVALLDDSNVNVRRASIQSLAWIGEKADAKTQKQIARALMKQFREEDDGNARLLTIHSLGLLGMTPIKNTRREIASFLIESLQDNFLCDASLECLVRIFPSSGPKTRERIKEALAKAAVGEGKIKPSAAAALQGLERPVARTVASDRLDREFAREAVRSIHEAGRVNLTMRAAGIVRGVKQAS